VVDFCFLRDEGEDEDEDENKIKIKIKIDKSVKVFFSRQDAKAAKKNK